MGIIANEGRYIRAGSLRDSAVKRKHPLNFMSKAVASHHLISCEATRRLSDYRKKQISYEGYDVNHIKNLVILPMKERISCQYHIPLHMSGHTDNSIVTHYEEQLYISLDGEVSKFKNEASKEEDENKKINSWLI